MAGLGRMSRISCSVALDAPGLQFGHLAVPWSDDAQAYGVIPVPIAVAAGGPGPTALLVAGVHGDEYEGQVALRRVLRALHPATLTGRVVVLPALNLPAVRVARRVSPIDGANLNRAFPGDPDGPPTAQIAHWVEAVLLPQVQVALDLHSGGAASEYLPCAYVYEGGPHHAAKRALAHAFGADLAVFVGSTAETRSLSAACERARVPMIAAELGGGATLSRQALAVAEAGIWAVLRHAGLLPQVQGDADRRTRPMRVPDRSHFLMCPRDGLFEPAVWLGDTVQPDDLAGWVHDTQDPSIPPAAVTFRAGGTVVARALPVLKRRGDTLFTTAVAA